jgi:hypothetical protein
MADFGTGLLAHLATTRELVVLDEPVLSPEQPRTASDDEHRRLETLAADLAGRELALAQREAELAVEHEKMALALARVLLQQTQQVAPAPKPVDDELAAFRARRYGAVS